jgi:hypothetical protein
MDNGGMYGEGNMDIAVFDVDAGIGMMGHGANRL